VKPAIPIYVHKRRALRLRLWDAVRDIPYLLADRISADSESRWVKALMALMLLSFCAAMALWLAAWWIR
jgi:hypothetical protein